MTNQHHNLPTDPVHAEPCASKAGEPMAAHDALTRAIIDDLARPLPSPDMTDHIMQRLGYIRMPAAEVQRRKRHRRAQCLAGATAVIAMLCVGIYAYKLSPNARQMEGGSVPAAVGHDVELHRNHFGELIQTIQNVAPQQVVPPNNREPEPSPSGQPGPADNADHKPEQPDEIDDAVNRSAVGDVMWV